VQRLFKQLDLWMKNEHPDLRNDLRRGYLPKRLDELIEESGADVNEELRLLLQWHCGHKSEEFNFSPDGQLLGDTGITELWSRWMERIYNERFPSAEWFHPSWIPFLGGEGVYLCVDSAGAFADHGGIPGQIVEFRPEAAARVIRYRSLSHWLETHVAAIEGRVYVLEGGRVVLPESQAEAFSRLYAEINPGYPKHVSSGEAEKPAFHRLLDAIRDRDLGRVRALLGDREVDVNRTGPDGRPPLVHAAIVGDPALVLEVLGQGAEVDWEDWTDGRRAIHFAAEYGPEAVPVLIRAGAEVNAPLQYSALTPLMLAAWKGHAQAVRDLLQAGAVPTKKSSLGETALSKCTDPETRAVLEEALGRR
jgi:cell wall assembly regulator SMI1